MEINSPLGARAALNTQKSQKRRNITIQKTHLPLIGQARGTDAYIHSGLKLALAAAAMPNVLGLAHATTTYTHLELQIHQLDKRSTGTKALVSQQVTDSFLSPTQM